MTTEKEKMLLQLRHPGSRTGFVREQRYVWTQHPDRGNDVWNGGSAVIGPGATIGARSVIGAGSIIVTDTPEDGFAAGSPG